MLLHSERINSRSSRPPRTLSLEVLENRYLLSITPAALGVVDVNVEEATADEAPGVRSGLEDAMDNNVEAMLETLPATGSGPYEEAAGTFSSDSYGGECYGGSSPTTTGISDVNVDEDAADEIIDLYDAFDDCEDADQDLAYEVTDNTNSSLFDSVDIDSYGGLVLDFADDAFGVAELTVKVTDTDGNSVETSFDVNVAAVNDAPVISGWGATGGPMDFYTFHGTVTDVDDDVEGMIVTLGGILEPYGLTVTVQADGTFSLTDQFPGLGSGTITAQTEDDDGLQSNLAMYLI